MDVIKRNGRKQIFSLAKLERSVQMAAKEAKLSAARGKELAREVGQGVHKYLARRRSVKSTELRKSVLKRLGSRSRSVVLAWQRYDIKKRKI